jgi:hypothetical protein
MKLDSIHLELCHESLTQQSQGENHIFSDQLTEKFLFSAEKRKLLAQLADGKTLYVLNWTWPRLRPRLKLPENYDTYIFLQYREPVDWPWFDQFAQAHPNQKIILLAPVQSSSTPHNNMQVVEHRHDANYVSQALVQYGQNYEFRWPRQYLVSSLCNKPSFFKVLITAYFHKNYLDRDDVVLSWNINHRKEICRSLDSLDSRYNRTQLDQMCDYYHSILKKISITQEPWVDEHYQNANWTTSCAYTNTLINFTNETYAPGQQFQRVLPGPTMTEKTRKAMMAGCAIVPVGQPGVYNYLKRSGLKFEYPWSCNFDTTPGDLDRTEQIFPVIDQIMSYDTEWLHNQLRDSVEHNYYHMRSTEYINCLREINQQAIIEYLCNRLA